jgi:DnaK suppressor protein
MSRSRYLESVNMSDGNKTKQALAREMLIRLQDDSLLRIKNLRTDRQREADAEPADEMDSARTTAEIETHAGLIAREEEKLNLIDEALVRLDAGRYGKCRACGEAIPFERLKAVPFAFFCVDCQDKRNRSRRDWGEGTTIPPFDQQWTPPGEMKEPTELEARSTDPEEQLTIREGVQAGRLSNQRAPRALPKKRLRERKKGLKL